MCYVQILSCIMCTAAGYVAANEYVAANGCVAASGYVAVNGYIAYKPTDLKTYKPISIKI